MKKVRKGGEEEEVRKGRQEESADRRVQTVLKPTATRPRAHAKGGTQERRCSIGPLTCLSVLILRVSLISTSEGLQLQLVPFPYPYISTSLICPHTLSHLLDSPTLDCLSTSLSCPSPSCPSVLILYNLCLIFIMSSCCKSSHLLTTLLGDMVYCPVLQSTVFLTTSLSPSYLSSWSYAPYCSVPLSTYR